jgi:hypothetical protein
MNIGVKYRSGIIPLERINLKTTEQEQRLCRRGLAVNARREMKRKLSQLRNPSRYSEFQCPKCGSAIAYFDVRIGFGAGYYTKYFECASCGSLLAVSRGYLWSVFLGLVVLSIGVTAALRVQPWWLFAIVALVISQLVGLLIGLYAKWLFPPEIQLYYANDSPLPLFEKKRK